MIPRGLSPRSASSFSRRSPILPWPPTMTTFTKATILEPEERLEEK
jgi:hypothetical protein